MLSVSTQTSSLIRNQLSKQTQNHPPLLFTKILNDKGRQFLDKMMTLKEIELVVKEGNLDKAPRPDGFTFGFF